jgi:hypothetical protein
MGLIAMMRLGGCIGVDGWVMVLAIIVFSIIGIVWTISEQLKKQISPGKTEGDLNPNRF